LQQSKDLFPCTCVHTTVLTNALVFLYSHCCFILALVFLHYHCCYIRISVTVLQSHQCTCVHTTVLTNASVFLYSYCCFILALVFLYSHPCSLLPFVFRNRKCRLRISHSILTLDAPDGRFYDFTRCTGMVTDIRPHCVVLSGSQFTKNSTF
jgi:hypothetical protein